MPGGSCYLAISVRAIVADNASRDILLTDIFTAFGQQLAGEEIALQPVTTPWTEWSQRCAALAVHPAVVESRDYWLKTATASTLKVASEQTAGAPALPDLARSASSLTVAETTEIDDARRRLRVPIDEMLLAALSRTIAHQVGDGTVAVDLSGEGRSVLKPDVDLRRTVGWFNTIYPIALTCAKDDGAKQLLDDVHNTLTAVPHYGIGYGLLRYLYAPTARQLGAAGRPTSSSPTSARSPICRRWARTSRSDSTPTPHCRCAKRFPGLGPRNRVAGLPYGRCAASGLVVRQPAGRRGHRAVTCQRVLPDIVGADPGSARARRDGLRQ